MCIRDRHSLVLRVAGIGESHLEGKVAHLLAGENPTAALYAKTGEVFIRNTAKAQDAAEMCIRDSYYTRLWFLGE